MRARALWAVVLVCTQWMVGCGALGTPESETPLPEGVASPTPPKLENLIAFAKSGGYRHWPAEMGPHASRGPHGGHVRTWLNDALFDSLQSTNATHPPGSVAVKELYGSDASGQTITGFAIAVKDEDGTWVFHEGFAPKYRDYYFRGTDNLCGSCHVNGSDYVLTSIGEVQTP